jgi:hypothetical protein
MASPLLMDAEYTREVEICLACSDALLIESFGAIMRRMGLTALQGGGSPQTSCASPCDLLYAVCPVRGSRTSTKTASNDTAFCSMKTERSSRTVFEIGSARVRSRPMVRRLLHVPDP